MARAPKAANPQQASKVTKAAIIVKSSRPPKVKDHPVFSTAHPSDYGRARAALARINRHGVRLTPAEIRAVIGESAGDLYKHEATRRILAL